MKYAIKVRKSYDRFKGAFVFEAFILRKSDNQMISCGKFDTMTAATQNANYWANI